MCNLRNVHGNRSSKSVKVTVSKKRQVLMQIFALRRMRDNRMLKWWSMILTVAYYCWRVGHKALDTTHTFDIVCCTCTRDPLLAKLTEDLVSMQTTFLLVR